MIFSSSAIFTVYPKLQHETVSHSSPERERAVWKNTGPSKNGRVKLNHIHMHKGSPLLLLSRSPQRHNAAAQGHFQVIHPT